MLSKIFFALATCLYMLHIPSYAQIVKQKFEKLVISENFDSAGTTWQTIASTENLFLVQNGEYIIQRKSLESPYALIGGFNRQFKDFRLQTSIKFVKAYGEKASVGILLMAQPGGSGGFVFEINGKNQYRLRQISEGVYLYLTGNQKDGGWIKMRPSTNSDGYNQIEIFSESNQYDLYINKTYIKSFSDPGYQAGEIGYIIGPGSQGKIDNLYIFEKSDDEFENVDSSNFSESSPDVSELAGSIIVLKNQVNDLNEENEALRKTISAMKSGEDESELVIRNNEKKIASLNLEIDYKDEKIDSLEQLNSKLLKYQEIVGSEENSDIIISLSKNLKLEREKSLKLEEENKILRQKLGLPATGKIKLENSTDKKANDSYDLPVKEN